MDSSTSSSLLGVFFCIVGLAVIGGLIALAVFLIKKSSEDVKRSEMTYNQVITQVPSDKQMLFVMQYNSMKKSPSTAVLLALFLGGLGAHKFYMGQTGMGILYLVFCWTYIPSIIAFIEAFTISGTVAKHNEEKTLQIAAMCGATNIGPAMMSFR